MSDHPSTERDSVEQLADSFVARFRAGERPSVEEYARRYPDLADELHELLPALVLLEQNAAPDDTSDTAHVSRPRVPDEIGDFAIVREIGRGGMGVVYEAIQQSLCRHVALKVLSSPGLLNPTHLERFQLEARAAARLHHTHIVPVFGVGELNGLHYYAMQFIQGQSLDLVIDELRRLRRSMADAASACSQGGSPTRMMAEGMLTGQFRAGADGRIDAVNDNDDGMVRSADRPASWTPKEHSEDWPSSPCSPPLDHNIRTASRSELTASHNGREFYRSVARVGLQVADALAYAHSEGILHRDIKPSNLLLDARGNVWITDFGLARDESSDGLTRTGDFVGTLRYMAPERLEGWSDRRSDLYGLGVTMYELLTLRPFLDTPGRSQLVEKILHENPPLPSKSDATIPRDLETIVLKAIAKEPAARYRTADELAEDLRLFLADRPILARRATLSEQVIRWCRRNRLVTALIMAIVAVVTFGLITTSYFAMSATRQAHIAQTEARGSQAVAQFLKDMLQAAGPSVARGRDAALLMEIVDTTSNRIYSDLDDQPAVQAELLDTLGTVYRDLGKYPQGESLLLDSLRLKRTIYGTNDASVADTLCALGDTYWQQRRNTEAETVFREALSIRRRLFGDESEDVAASLFGLAEVLRRAESKSALEEAESLHREALATRRQLFGTDHRKVAKSLTGLGITLHKLNNPEEVTCFREALEIQRRILGNEHPETAYTLCNLGLALAGSSENREDEQVLREALRIQSKVLGDHRDTAYTMNFLGDVLQRRGQLEEAEQLHRSALEIQRRALGRHPDVGVTLQYLGWNLVTQNRLADAEAAYRETFALRRSLLGQEHPYTAAVHQSLVRVLRSQEKLDAAESITRDYLEVLEQQAPDNWIKYDARSILGEILLDQERYAEAEPLLISGYNGMKQHAFQIVAGSAPKLERAQLRVIRLFEATDRHDQAEQWRRSLLSSTE